MVAFNPKDRLSCAEAHIGGSRESDRGSGPPGKLQVAIGFLRNIGTDPLENHLDSLGPDVSLGRFIRPFVKYADDLTKTTSESNHIIQQLFKRPYAA